jgi:hypothetical protein
MPLPPKVPPISSAQQAPTPPPGSPPRIIGDLLETYVSTGELRREIQGHPSAELTPWTSWRSLFMIRSFSHSSRARRRPAFNRSMASATALSTAILGLLYRAGGQMQDCLVRTTDLQKENLGKSKYSRISRAGSCPSLSRCRNIPSRVVPQN